MPINAAQLQRLQSTLLQGPDRGTTLPRPREAQADGELGFADTLRHAVHQADGAQKHADAQVAAFVAGEQEDLHEVMLAMNDAKLSFQLMTEVRNKMLETYQELMRMQI